jgi:predicted amidophosphoribosyltransferase
MGRCSRCGEPTDTTYRLCDPCLAESVRTECAEQGVPERIEDAETLRKLERLSRPRRQVR